jgi:hypothetical protein
MRYCKCTSNALYISVPVTNIGVCQFTYILACVNIVCVCLGECVIVDFLLLSFKLSLGCLFSPHHVNQGGVQRRPRKSLFTSGGVTHGDIINRLNSFSVSKN